MKLAKLSLAAIVVAGLVSSSFAADTLADAFKNGKVTGEIKAFYFDRDNGTGAENASIFVTGLMLNYVTDSLNGFKVGATMQSSNAPFASTEAKSVFKTDMYGPGAVLSEAYLEYTIAKTTAKVGRQFISSPLVSNSGSRVIKGSFEGATLINTDLPNTTLGFIYVDKWQARTNNGLVPKTLGEIADFKQIGDGGAYSLYVINKSIPGTMLSAAWVGVENSNYATTDGDMDLFRLEATYNGKASNFSYNLGGQYFVTEYSGTSKDSNGFALKAGVGVSNIDAYVAYSKISDDGKVKYGVGYGADSLYTQSPIISDNYGAGTEAYAVDIAYNFNADAKIGIDYTTTEDVANKKLSYSAVYGSYKFGGALKGLGVLVQYEEEGKDGDAKELRFKANYKF
ncbi:MAG: porin [Sulfurospirillaceae bacterium]|nr:porin [Sulfurospirillaceae bacterium]MDD2826492.1 porin [Sulfurospirillaceae bacterium]